jgi:hypothetical protein
LEQSALGTLKIERLDRQATEKFLESNATNRTAMVTRARGIITQIRTPPPPPKKNGFDWNNLKEKRGKKSVLPGGESNPGLPRGRDALGIKATFSIF